VRRLAQSALLLLLLAGPAGAQVSQFGVRALGIPSLPIATRAEGTAGAFALFDAESALNPASIIGINRPTATFNITQNWRTSENPFGTATGNDSRFPLFLAAGAIGRRFTGAVSASVYSDRTFALGLEDTLVVSGRDVVAYDTLVSHGGISDIRVAGAYALTSRISVGVGLHLLTGSNRLEYRRRLVDSAFASAIIASELSYSGLGASLGVTARPTAGLAVAGYVRLDGELSIDRDTTDVGAVTLPRTLGLGVQWIPTRRFALAGQALHQTWSRMDQDLKDRGGTGARNTLRLAGGGEFIRDPVNPGRLPVRIGVRWGELPFPMTDAGTGGTEFALALGSGFTFAGGRGTFDVAVERVWREDGTAFRERAFSLKLGVGVRP